MHFLWLRIIELIVEVGSESLSIDPIDKETKGLNWRVWQLISLQGTLGKISLNAVLKNGLWCIIKDL